MNIWRLISAAPVTPLLIVIATVWLVAIVGTVADVWTWA